MTGLSDDQRIAWRRAQELWGVQLHDPLEKSDAHMQTFAWFSFPPQVHFDLRDATRRGLSGFFESIFAHEIGHHVLSPSTRLDSLKIVHQMARAISATDATRITDPRSTAHDFANLWSDMLINVRVAQLQVTRDPAAQPEMISLWRVLSSEPTRDRFWWVVLRAYEQLWSKPPGFLVPARPPAAPPPSGPFVPSLDRGPEGEKQADKALRIAAHEKAIESLVATQREFAELSRTNPELDATVLAETARTFGDDPVSGALRFGMIAAPYVLRDEAPSDHPLLCGGLLGSRPATPGELVAVMGDARLREVPMHPALEGAAAGETVGVADQGGQGYGVAQTLALYTGSDKNAVTAAWYQAAARPWVRPLLQSSTTENHSDSTIPGALTEWALGDDLSELDWPASLATSATIIPGITTRRREWMPDADPDGRESVRLDLYIDSSGSMRRPNEGSPAVLAGTILILSVLSGGGRVRVTSFSAAGEVAGGARFTRDRAEALRDLCFYFGRGTTFPLDVLSSRYAGVAPLGETRRHVVVLSDDGLMSLFGEGQPQFADVAGQVRSVLDTATLIVQDPRHSIAAAAAKAGYDAEYLASMEEAPAVCARLAARLTRPREVLRG